MKLIKLIFPFVLSISIFSCSGTKQISYSNASFTEKEEIMITANKDYSIASIVGHGGELALIEKQKLFAKSIAEKRKEINNIEGVQIDTLHMNENEIIAVVDNDILFDYNSFELNQEAVQILSKLSPIINDMPTDVKVVGHTDNTGTMAYNLKLSENRANSVANYMEKLGVKNISTLGEAFKTPIATNNTEKGRRRNRRVEIILSINPQ